METDRYKTLEKEAEATVREKASKFIAYVRPCREEQHVKQLVSELRKLHPKARHVCYAARWWAEGNLMEKSSDDHEPSGTAGLPILNRMRSADVSDAAVAVVRYFGGTLLGKSGLIQAYGEAAAAALALAGTKEKQHSRRFRLHFGYEATDRVTHLLQVNEAEIIEKIFDADCTFVIDLPRSRAERICSELSEAGAKTITHLQ
ncbi:MAG: YigZ family protein [Flavobacteriales bacterium]|nr:YigZ family protein [Flavobacteriales bacterium]MCB9448024.1 YigZ family protein [Flavobacteriales bacterium]